MAKKSTHIGECQACGHTQKLPGGALSLHGYTTQWGFFQGTCDGACELPYELSCDYCKMRITRAEGMRDKAIEMAKHYRRPITVAVADYVTVVIGRDPRTYRDITFQVKDMVLVDALNTKFNFNEVHGTYERDGQIHTVNFSKSNGPLYSTRPKDALEAARMLNERLAKEQDRLAEQLQGYINWQQARVNDWKLRELKPVVDEAKTVGNGDKILLKALTEHDGPMKIGYYSSSFRHTRNGRYTQATKLATLGLVEILERNDTGRPWLTAKITKAGKASLQEA